MPPKPIRRPGQPMHPAQPRAPENPNFGKRIRVKEHPGERILYEGPERRTAIQRRAENREIELVAAPPDGRPKTIRGEIREGIIKIQKWVKKESHISSSFEGPVNSPRLHEIEQALLSGKKLKPGELERMLHDVQEVMRHHNI
ncbi:MAG: hypothetical protein AABW99_05355 [archaeon]